MKGAEIGFTSGQHKIRGLFRTFLETAVANVGSVQDCIRPHILRQT